MKKWFSPGLLISGIFLFSWHTMVAQANSDSLYQSALSSIDSGYYVDAIDKLCNLISVNENNAGYYFARARAYESTSQYKEARNDYSSIIRLNKNDTNAYLLRGKANILIHEPGLAKNDMKKYTSLKPGDAEGWYYFAHVYMDPPTFFDFKKAMHYLDKTYSMDSTRYQKIIREKGDSWLWKGKPENALSFYNLAMERNSADPYNYLARTNIWLRKKDTAAAVKDCLKALDLAGTDSVALIQSLEIMISLGYTEDAFIYFGGMIAANNQSIPGLSGMGNVYMATKQYGAAYKYYNQLVEYHPQYARGYFLLGYCKMQMGKREEGRDDIKKAARMHDQAAKLFLQDNPTFMGIIGRSFLYILIYGNAYRI